MITTTLNDIRKHKPCIDGWKRLLKFLGKSEADDEPLPLLTIMDSNGYDDALWCLRVLGPEHAGWIRHYAVDCAEDVGHLLTDERSREALRVARRHADGLATDAELAAARDAAWAAAREAARAAAWAAAGDAAWAAAWAAAREAAWAAAREAAWAAAREAARAAAGDAARDAARDAQAVRLRAILTQEAA